MVSLSHDIAMKMAKQQDSLIKSVIDDVLGERAGYIETHRLHIEIRGQVNTVLLDGKPILELYPVQFETVKTEFSWNMLATQNYRRL